MNEQEQSQGILTKQKRKAFVMSPNHLFCNPSISSVAKTLWQVLESKPEGWKFFWSEILKHFKEGRDSVKNSIKELESLGYVKKKKAKKGNIYCGMDIEVFYDPSLPFDEESKDSARVTEFQESETQMPESWLSENKGTYKKSSKQDLSKKESSLSIPTLEDCLAHAEREKFLIDVEKFYKFYFVDSHKKYRSTWQQLMRTWAEKPSNQIKNPQNGANVDLQESKEIENIRHKIKRVMPNQREYDMNFAGCRMEKDSAGFTIFADNEKALVYALLLNEINVKIEVK